jgi:hypothetical protein
MGAVLKPKNSKPVRERVSRQEWQMRVDLAAAYQPALLRLLERRGINYLG